VVRESTKNLRNVDNINFYLKNIINITLEKVRESQIKKDYSLKAKVPGAKRPTTGPSAIEKPADSILLLTALEQE